VQDEETAPGQGDGDEGGQRAEGGVSGISGQRVSRARILRHGQGMEERGQGKKTPAKRETESFPSHATARRERE